MLLNDDIVDIEKPDGLSSLTFVVNKFSRFVLLQSVLLKINLLKIQDLHK